MRSPQPNSLCCFVCGVENPAGLHLRFYETNPGEVAADCILPEIYQGYPGIIHGGVVAAMLDEAAGRSQMGTSDNPRFMFTAKLDIRYRKNVPVLERIKLVGKAGETRGRTAAASSAIYDQDGTLLAEANAILINVPQDLVEGTDLERLGWKIYPEE